MTENCENVPKTLFVFDCDHTLINVDSDVEISLLGEPLPAAVKALHDGHFWTDYMNAVFRHIHSKGVTTERIRTFLRKLPLVPGMPELFKTLMDNERFQNVEIIIVSDANEFGIREIVQRMVGPEHLDAVVPMVTNRAVITEQDCLLVLPFQWQRNCDICPPNLCKGQALEDYTSTASSHFSRIVYIGDGKNDVCPASRLSGSDIILARKGYKLHQTLEFADTDCVVKAELRTWKDGFDILNNLKTLI